MFYGRVEHGDDMVLKKFLLTVLGLNRSTWAHLK